LGRCSKSEVFGRAYITSEDHLLLGFFLAPLPPPYEVSPMPTLKAFSLPPAYNGDQCDGRPIFGRTRSRGRRKVFFFLPRPLEEERERQVYDVS